MPTPTMRVRQVSTIAEADIMVMVVTDQKRSTLDVAVVASATLADAAVLVVTDESDADEFVFVSEGSFA